MLFSGIGVDRGGQRGHTPTFFEYVVILCFERRYLIKNSVASLKSKIWPPKKFLTLRNFRLATLLFSDVIRRYTLALHVRGEHETSKGCLCVVSQL